MVGAFRSDNGFQLGRMGSLMLYCRQALEDGKDARELSKHARKKKSRCAVNRLIRASSALQSQLYKQMKR